MRPVKVRAVMTCGRQEITYCRTRIELAMKQVGIPLNVSLGVYYGQLMQKMFEDSIKDELDYIITVDGDSVFTGNQLHRLLSIAVQEGCDALAAMQVRRGAKTLLGFKEGQSSAVWDGKPIEVHAAHFGLTIIDVSKLRTVAKPWFYCKPADDGTWGEGRIDSDVWFWKQWREAGHKLYIEPGTRIGHVEEMVVMHDDNFQIKHYYPKDYDKEMESIDNQIDEELETPAGGVDPNADTGCGGSPCQPTEGCCL
jgi:hypothetical protein